MEINVLILGNQGMLGHMLSLYFETQKNIKIIKIKSRWPEESFFNEIKNFKGQFIINCIGAIPQKTKNFHINYELPIWLSENSNCAIIHPGTDCEMDMDDYGLSKKKASDYIKNISINTKILKSSIIGPEINNSASLLEWFLNNNNKYVNGYTDAMWNGVTTLEWAKQCYKLIENWNDYKKETIIQSNCISKYELLITIKNIFEKQIEILPISGLGKNKCLNGEIFTKDISQQIIELKKFYYK
jgi:dTDP-4-dehydrorhamnose reductase